MKKLLLLSIALALINGANATGTIHSGKDIYNICDFGAIGDGNALNTKAIQKAIDACSEAGGGTVYFPPGTYKSGTVYLKSYVTLELETGAVLLGSKDMKDYIKAEEGSYIYGPGSQYAFLHGKNVDHVSIIGQGIIDGNTALDHGSRGPLAVIFTNSENILMQGITVANSPGWSVTIFACRYVDIIRVKVLNGFADGINPVCSRDVLLDGVLIDHSGDDPITIKNEGPAKEFLSENIKIINTTVRNTTHPAVKIGTGTAGVFRNIIVSNCTFSNTGDMFTIQLMRKTRNVNRTIENILFSNIVATGVNRLLDWTSMNLANPDLKTTGPIIRRIMVRDIIASDVKNPSRIMGLSEVPIQDISLQNIRMTYSQKKDADPHWLHVRYVNGLQIQDVNLQLAQSVQSALVCESVHDLELKGLRITGNKGEYPLIKLIDVQGALIRSCQAPAGQSFIYAEGRSTKDIQFIGNDFLKTDVPFITSGDMNEGVASPVASEIIYDHLQVPGSVDPDEVFPVNVSLTNKGSSGVVNLRLFVDGDDVCSKWLWLRKGEKRLVELTQLRYYVPKTYAVSIGQLTASLEVNPAPAAFQYGDQIQFSAPASAGALTRLSVPLRNIGGRKGIEIVRLIADGEVVNSKKVTLMPGEEQVVTIEHRFEKSGPRTLQVGDFPPCPFFTFANTEAEFCLTRKGFIIKASGGPKSSANQEDKYGSVYMKIKGDFVSTVKLISQQTDGQDSDAGLMVRNNITQPAKSPGYVVLYRRPKYGGGIDWRGDLDGNGLTDVISYGHGVQAQTFPLWLKIEKVEKSFTGYSSRDGFLWQPTQIQPNSKLQGRYKIPFTDEIQNVGIYANDQSATNNMSRVEMQDFKIEQQVPALFQDLKISKTIIGVDESFSISTTVTNNGSVEGPVKAGLFIDGHEPFSRWIDLKPGESRIVLYETTPAEIQKALWYVVLPGFISGTHEITIGSAPPQKITIVEGKNQY